MKRLWINTCAVPIVWALFLSLFSLPLFSSFPEEGKDIRKPRWQFEISGGVSWLQGGDMNRFADYEKAAREFFYDRCLNHLKDSQQIVEWNSEQNGDWRKLHWGIPAVVRLKYNINPRFSMSLASSFLHGWASSRPEAGFTRVINDRSSFDEAIDYHSFVLNASAWIPQFGIHRSWRLGPKWEFEGRIAGGPLISNCRFESDRTYEMIFVYRTNNVPEEFLLFEKEDRIDLRGKGTGISLEAAGRLTRSFGKRMEAFIEAVYAYQRSGRISGSGWEERGGVRREWEGEWYMKKETIVTPWGSLETEVPTNEPPGDREWEKAGEFHLQLSGLQVRFGIAYRF